MTEYTLERRSEVVDGDVCDVWYGAEMRWRPAWALRSVTEVVVRPSVACCSSYFAVTTGRWWDCCARYRCTVCDGFGLLLVGAIYRNGWHE